MSNQSELAVANGGNQATPLQMVQTAMERGMDAATIKEFMDLADRHEAKQAKRAFDQAMSEFRSRCPTIARSAKAHNSNYAPLDKTIDQIKGLMHECGLSHSWRTAQDGDKITVTCVVSHVDGHSEQTSLSSAPDDGGKMNSIQRIGSAVSYLERYTLFAILGLASGDMDDDGNTASVEVIDDGKLADLQTLIDEIPNFNRQAFDNWLMKAMKVPGAKLEKISVKAYPEVVRMLEAKRKAS